MRLDQYLVHQGLAESRARAQGLIKAGLIKVNGQIITRSAELVEGASQIEVMGQEHPWVSRSGLKLAAAAEHFKLSAEDKICLDIGASTGGFTDVLLSQRAKKVYAVDVGHHQLAPKLQADKRVIRLEGLNSRNLCAEDILEAPEVIVIDVSFISLKLALPPALALAAPAAWCIALIKPQFEVGRENVGKGGLVKDHHLYPILLDDMTVWFSQQGWPPLGIIASPITGGDGNQEFLLAAIRG
jgi:23S rRNA (cytidine1920-2'-O)/16S rRNA (cytidine1409-2'-O)-methyltransferase